MVNDSIADLLTRIRNAQRAGHRGVRVSAFGTNRRILEVLKDEGFIESFSAQKNTASNVDEFEVVLKYFSSGEPVMGRIARISKPGRRVYCECEKLPVVKNGLGIAIVSTSEGVMSDREARRRKIGGEVWAHIG